MVLIFVLKDKSIVLDLVLASKVLVLVPQVLLLVLMTKVLVLVLE